jgi:hypothetical protein
LFGEIFGVTEPVTNDALPLWIFKGELLGVLVAEPSVDLINSTSVLFGSANSQAN